ncbi:MAG: MFS transporter [Firmicutes bacterium]|nr:MFS transporter [Bacillota bacterium]
MIDSLNEYIVAIYNLNKAQYGLIVVALMSVVGVSVGLFTEIVLRLFGRGLYCHSGLEITITPG